MKGHRHSILSDGPIISDAAGKAAERKTKRLYTKVIVAEIAGCLPGFVNSSAEKEFPAILRQWATACLLYHQRYDVITQIEHRKHAYQSIADSAAELVSAYTQMNSSEFYSMVKLSSTLAGSAYIAFLDDRTPLHDVERGFNNTMDGVAQLRDAALKAVANIGPARRGPPRTLQRRVVAVMALAHIYFDMTGKKPARRYNAYTGQSYGPFQAFCIAALKPIEGEAAATNIENLLSKAVKYFSAGYPYPFLMRLNH